MKKEGRRTERPSDGGRQASMNMFYSMYEYVARKRSCLQIDCFVFDYVQADWLRIDASKNDHHFALGILCRLLRSQPVPS